MVEVQNLSHRFRNLEVLHDINFVVKPNEIMGLIGPNGSGKSTTIRCLTGILRPTAGTVRLSGYDIVRDPVKAKQGLAYLPDNPALFENLTCWEHVEFNAKIYGIDPYRDRATALLEEFQLTQKRDALGSELSRGMRQRLSLVCALMHSPTVMLLDEPMLGLDPKGIRLLNNRLRKAAEDGTAVIISSHLLALLEEVCTKVLVLSQGHVRLYGLVDEVRKEIHRQTERLSLEELFFHVTE